MDTPPSNQTDFPPSEDPLEDPVDPDAPSPPPPSSSTTPPYPPEEPPPDNEPPPPKSPEMTPLPPENFFPSPSSPPPKIPTPSGNPQPVTPSNKPYNSPPPPFYDSGLSQSPPSPSFARTPPGGQLTPNPLILSPPSLSGVPLVPPGGPANSPNNVSGISESKVGTIDTTAVVATGLVSCFVLLGVIGMAVWWIWGGKKKVGPDRATRLGSSPQADSALFKMRTSSAYYSSEYDHESACETPGMGSAKNSYSYKELARATNEFSESNLLGEGGFGSVFKGLLPDGRKVAVKQLKDGGSQGEREFRAEVETISRIHHRHLVSLVGYCISDDKRLLVYDFVPNNTLYFHLHGKGVNFLDWPTRIKIATGAARGIAYLHEDCHPRIIHRDIKSSNILLDKNFEAQVSDFGLARFFSDLNTYVTTRVVGTFGYMAPEYASSGKLTEKSDVFSFGVVLLELITGRKPVDTSQPPGEESLVEWARPLLDYALDKEKFENLVDPRLGKNYVDSEMFQAIESATACVQYSDLKRPKMSRILRAFEDMTLSDDSNEIRGGQSETHESPRQSAEIRLFQRMAFGSQDFNTDFFTESDWKSEEK